MKLFRCTVLLATLCVCLATAAADAFYDTYQRGLAAFKTKKYADARADFLGAYDLRPEPVILFNVAQTYRLEHRSAQALDYYKRFLRESKIADDLRRDAEAYVAALEAEQVVREARARIEADTGPKGADQRPVKMPAPPMDASFRGSSTRPERDKPNDSRLSSEPGALVSDHRHASMQTSSNRVSFVVGGGALVLVGGGLGFELRAESRYAAARSETTSQSRRDSLYNAANANRHVAVALTVSGLAASGAAVWLFLRNRKGERHVITGTTVRVVPMLAGLALSGQF